VAAVVVVAVAPQSAGHLDQLGTQLGEGGSQLQRWAVEEPLHLGPDQLGRGLGALQEAIRANATTLASGALSGASLAIEVVAGSVLARVLTFFFVKDGDRIASWALSLVPDSRRGLARRLGRRTFATLGSYVRGSALLGTAEGLAIGGGLALLGVPLAAPLGVLLTAVAAGAVDEVRSTRGVT